MSVINIKIKSSGDKKYDVEVDTDSSIADLKVIIAAALDIAPECQRLIYSGKVLKDVETVASYKIQDGHSVHLVKSMQKAGGAAAAASSTSNVGAASGGNSGSSGSSASGGNSGSGAVSGGAATGIPSNISAGQGSYNPLADLTGARYAGYAQLPSASMFGPDGGMGAFQDPEQLEQLLLLPQFQEQMNALMLNPQMMDMLLSQNPQLRDMSPEARQMLQPMFREMMSNPESLRSIISLNRAMSGAGGAGLGGPGSFPAPGNPSGETDASTGSQDASGASSGAPPSAFPGLPGFGQGAGANPFANFWGPAGNPATTAAADNRPPEERYEDQLRQLNEMGFADFDMNVAALRRCGGNVQGAIEYLLSLSNF